MDTSLIDAETDSKNIKQVKFLWYFTQIYIDNQKKQIKFNKTQKKLTKGFKNVLPFTADDLKFFFDSSKILIKSTDWVKQDKINIKASNFKLNIFLSVLSISWKLVC